jgi:hypothetical protein
MSTLKIQEVITKTTTSYIPHPFDNKRTVRKGTMVWVQTAKKLFVLPRPIRVGEATVAFLNKLHKKGKINTAHWTEISAS